MWQISEEERTVIELQAQFGNKWAQIVTHLSGRTDNDVKNFWSGRQKRLARILQTPAPSSSKSQKTTKELKVLATDKVPSFSSSTEDESATKTKSCSSSNVDNSQTIQTVLPELVHPNMLRYEHSPFPFSKDTVFEGTDYKLSLSFPTDYPFKPPKVKFETSCFHPNVDVYGNICLDILQDKWSSAYDVRTIFLSLIKPVA